MEFLNTVFILESKYNRTGMALIVNLVDYFTVIGLQSSHLILRVTLTGGRI